MNLLNYYLRITHYCRVYSVRSFIGSIFLRIWRKLFKNRKIIFFISCNEIDEKKLQLREDISVKNFAKAEDIPQEDLICLYTNKGGKILVMDYLKKNFQKGGTVWLAYLNGEVVGWRWTCVNGYNGFYFFPSTPKDVVFFDGEIFPQYRGKGISPTMLQYMFVALKKAGIERIYGDVLEWNNANIRSLPKTGLKMIGIARELNICGGKYIIWYKKKYNKLKSSQK